MATMLVTAIAAPQPTYSTSSTSSTCQLIIVMLSMSSIVVMWVLSMGVFETAYLLTAYYLLNIWPVKPFETVMVFKGYTNKIEYVGCGAATAITSMVAMSLS